VAIIKDEKFQGIISSSNLYKITKDGSHDIQRAIVKRDMVTCATPNDSLDDVARKMKRSRNRTLPVLNNDIIVGVITSHDILEKMRRDVDIKV
jgi:CBS domain-containing protein